MNQLNIIADWTTSWKKGLTMIAFLPLLLLKQTWEEIQTWIYRENVWGRVSVVANV